MLLENMLEIIKRCESFVINYNYLHCNSNQQRLFFIYKILMHISKVFLCGKLEVFFFIKLR
jgi:hypothetical protein